MSSNNEIYVGAYIRIPGGLDLAVAVYDWEDRIKEDTFMDALSEAGADYNIWISNYCDDNLLHDGDGTYLTFSPLIAGKQLRRFLTKFSKELDILNDKDIDYTVEFGVVSYWF